MRIKKRVIMITAGWFLVILVGTITTFWGTYKLTQFWTDKEAFKKSYMLPDIIELDCKMKLKVSEDFKKEILSAGLNPDKNRPNYLSLTPYFDKYLFETNQIAQKNYKIYDDEMYNKFQNMQVHIFIKTKLDSMSLKRNSDKIVLTSEKLTNSTINVKGLDLIDNILDIDISNLQLIVESQSLYIADFDKATYNAHFILSNQIYPIEIELGILKTKKTQYYYLSSPIYNDGEIEGIVKSMIDFD